MNWLGSSLYIYKKSSIVQIFSRNERAHSATQLIKSGSYQEVLTAELLCFSTEPRSMD